MKNTTLLFLQKKNDSSVTDICLAMKKRGFGVGRYNGVGGKVEHGESIEDATRREAEEEIGVSVSDMTKVAELTFRFQNKEDWNQLVHVYTTDSWSGEIVETEEMKPEWFSVTSIPYDRMWPDDVLWLPQVLQGAFVTGEFLFGEGDVILESEVACR